MATTGPSPELFTGEFENPRNWIFTKESGLLGLHALLEGEAAAAEPPQRQRCQAVRQRRRVVLRVLRCNPSRALPTGG